MSPRLPRCAALLSVLIAAAGVRDAAPQGSRGSPAAVRADSFYAAGDRLAATQAYRAVLSGDPENSHATFRLAQLTRDHSRVRELPLIPR